MLIYYQMCSVAHLRAVSQVLMHLTHWGRVTHIENCFELLRNYRNSAKYVLWSVALLTISAITFYVRNEYKIKPLQQDHKHVLLKTNPISLSIQGYQVKAPGMGVLWILLSNPVSCQVNVKVSVLWLINLSDIIYKVCFCTFIFMSLECIKAIINLHYHEISNTRCTKSQNLNISHLILQFSLRNRLKPLLSQEWRCS